MAGFCNPGNLTRTFDKRVLLTNRCVIKNPCGVKEVGFYAIFACIRVERSSARLSPDRCHASPY